MYTTFYYLFICQQTLELLLLWLFIMLEIKSEVFTMTYMALYDLTTSHYFDHFAHYDTPHHTPAIPASVTLVLLLLFFFYTSTAGLLSKWFTWFHPHSPQGFPQMFLSKKALPQPPHVNSSVLPPLLLHYTNSFSSKHILPNVIFVFVS